MINIPREAVDKAFKQTHMLRIQFVSYKNSKFFRANNINGSSSSLTNTKQQVISASVSSIHIDNLTEPLDYTFHNFYGNRKQKCVYWDPESKFENYQWSNNVQSYSDFNLYMNHPNVIVLR